LQFDSSRKTLARRPQAHSVPGALPLSLLHFKLNIENRVRGELREPPPKLSSGGDTKQEYRA
jgi:hypothetical protein